MPGRLCNFASALSIVSVNTTIASFSVTIVEKCRLTDAADARIRPSKSLDLADSLSFCCQIKREFHRNHRLHRFHIPKLPDSCLVYPFQEGFNGIGADLYRLAWLIVEI